MTHLNISDLTPGINGNGVYVVKTRTIKQTSTGKDYLDATISDATGEIKARMWGVDSGDDLMNSLKEGGPCRITFKVDSYQGNPQLILNSIEGLTVSDVGDISFLVPYAPKDRVAMYQRLWDKTENFENKELKIVVQRALSENKDILLVLPGAKSMHHAVIGGWLWHTTGLLDIAECLCTLYPQIDKDLLCSGVMLHDIGKIWEFEVGPLGLVTDYSIDGNLYGHLVIGADYVGNICRQENISPEIQRTLRHIILSHHEVAEFGACKRPAFTEAYLVHACDMIDAKVNMYSTCTEELEEGELGAPFFGLDKLRIYHHKNLSETEDNTLPF